MTICKYCGQQLAEFENEEACFKKPSRVVASEAQPAQPVSPSASCSAQERSGGEDNEAETASRSAQVSGRVELRLLRCPFCNARPNLRKGKRYSTTVKHSDAGQWWMKPGIGCPQCGFRRDFETVEAARSWWNRRAATKTRIPPDAHPAEGERAPARNDQAQRPEAK